MNGEEIPRDEMLLDVCLEEVLSGQAPPDLSAPILAALHNRPSAASAPLPIAEPPVAAPPVSAPPVHTEAPAAANVSAPAYAAPLRTRESAGRRARTHAAQQRNWFGFVTVALLLVVGVGVVLAALQMGGWNDGPSVATLPDGDRGNTNANRRRDDGARHVTLTENPFKQPLFGAEPLEEVAQRGVPWSLPYAVGPQEDANVIAFVDERLKQRWNQAGIEPAPAADDDQWCRRVYQQVIGRQPTSEELVDFATSKSPDRRQQLVAKLLGDEHREEFARHWADVWTSEYLAAAPAGDSPALSRRDGLRDYFYQSLRDGKPHNEIAQELLTATGSPSPEAADYNAAAGLIASGASEDKSHIAATVGRAMLGRQAQCAQCHDAPDGGGFTQQEFWQLAAFFQQTQVIRDEAQGEVRVADVDFVGPTGDAGEAELLYEKLDGQRKIAYPVFVDGTRISPAGRVVDVNRRQELARLVAGSEEFSKATVNQVWARLLGRGLVDEQAARDGDASSHPDLLQRLAEQFAAHQFDQKRLIEWIALSQANARGAGRRIDRDDADSRSDRMFARFRGPTALPEPMYDWVAVAISDVSRGGRPIPADRTLLFARTAPGAEAAEGNNTAIFVPADSTARREPASDFVKRMITSDMTFAAKVDHIFLHALARRPSPEERTSAVRTLAYHHGDIAAALDDLWWAITNSSEYRAR